MKTSLALFVIVGGLLLAYSFAGANPALLPKHPGYPMGNAVDPVKGQSLANDPGQANAIGEDALTKAAVVDDGHSKQNLSVSQEEDRLLETPGAGLLPTVQGPNIRIEPPVKEGTKVRTLP